MKKVLAIIVVALIFLGWGFSMTGAGPVEKLKDQLKLGLDFQGGVYVVMEAQTDATGSELRKLMEQTQAIIEGRVNRMGLSEPIVTIEGLDKIRVELPGAEDARAAIETIGKTAQLQFALGDGRIMVDGSMVKHAGVGKDEKGFPAVTLEFNSEGAVAFEEATRLASTGQVINPQTNQSDNIIYILLDDQVISAPAASGAIPGGKAIITGKFTTDEVTELALLIQGGALPVGLEEVQTSVIGPTLGIDSLKSSLVAGVIGVGLVALVMLVGYWFMGLVANIALALYILITFWVLALLAAVLNLPGIAGVILSIGMAVDANVIIFARIREEYQNGKSLRVATDSGFKRAMATIIDSQLTTMIAGVILYQFGTGPVKGFAMTLMIGILVSVLTAVIVTRFLLKTAVDTKFFGRPQLLGVDRKTIFKRDFNFIRYKKWYYIISVAVIVIGLGSGFVRGFNTGIDFTGGTMLHLNMNKVVTVKDIEKIMNDNNMDCTVVHAGEGNKEIVIKTTSSLDTKARQELMEAFHEKYGVEEKDIIAIEQFSPSIGKLLKQNAFKAVLIAAIGILIYIIIRFEWKFGIAALVALIHDVLVVVAFYGLFRIPINNPFIAAVLIIVGYSINDTIVVFDRIRENLKIMKKSKLEELVDKSINQTLVRSVMTSVTTVVAIVPLYIMGGATIREFTLPLMIGIVAGAVSSIVIASPVYFELDRLINKPKYKG